MTGNGISKLVFTILSAVAEAERDRIRARVALIAHARTLRVDGATLRTIQAVLETQHRRRLSFDALHRVLAQRV